MRIVLISFLLLLSFNSIAGDTTDYRKEIVAIMEKVISKGIKDGNFQYKGDVVYISSGANAPGFSVYSDGFPDYMKFTSVIGTFVYIKWNKCNGLYLTKNTLGKMRSSFNSLKYYYQNVFKKRTNDLSFSADQALEYIENNSPYIINYPSTLENLPTLDD